MGIKEYFLGVFKNNGFQHGGYAENLNEHHCKCSGLCCEPLRPGEVLIIKGVNKDPLQDSINHTASACVNAHGQTLLSLESHLERLLDLQYFKITEEDDAEANPSINFENIAEAIINDIKKGGPISRTLQETFDLKRRGV